jgi:hypothetical protein
VEFDPDTDVITKYFTPHQGRSELRDGVNEFTGLDEDSLCLRSIRFVQALETTQAVGVGALAAVKSWIRLTATTLPAIW